MKWEERCLLELTHRNVFGDEAHRLRFRDLLTCYVDAPFFTKGLCKCMFLNASTERHFYLLLDTLNEITLEGARDLKLMRDSLVYRMTTNDPDDIAERAFIHLSIAFLDGEPYEMPDIAIIAPDGVHAMRNALLAASYIDELPPITR